MANYRYILMRTARHFMPDTLARMFLLNRFIIRPSLETSSPNSAVERYSAALAEEGVTIKDKRVMVFGYGGKPEIGSAIMQSGAREVLLVERPGLELEPNAALDPEKIIRLHQDIRTLDEKELQPVDIVVTHSVFEHLTDASGIAAALARFTKPGGCQLHYIDLRDHYFKYPFEMLKFSDQVWKNWLNPTSNLNRLRLFEYERIFKQHFKNVKISVTERNIDEFIKAKPAIQPQFLSGNDEQDAVTLIRVFARN